MAVTDFLFGGTTPPEVSTFSSTTQNVPDWWASYVKGTVAKASQIAGEPYQAYTGPRVAGASTDQTSAYDKTRANVGNTADNFTQAGNLYNTAGGTSSLDAAQPFIDAAQGKSATGAAQPYMDLAAQTLPGSINAYMSPYTEGVTNRIAELGNRNLTERLLPQLQDQFIAAGQAGSTRGSEFASRAVRDTANEIAGQQAQALERGYDTAGQQFNADKARQGNLASTAGGLAGAEQTNLANLGALSGQVTSDTANRQITAGNAITNLGAQQQTAGIKDAAALQAIGQEQQALQQRNLDTAYQDFVQQRDYPKEQIGFLNQAIRGVNPPESKSTQTTGPATNMGTSPLAQIAGAAGTAYGLKQAGVFSRDGGFVNDQPVKRFEDGGYVDDVPYTDYEDVAFPSDLDIPGSNYAGRSTNYVDDTPYTNYGGVPHTGRSAVSGFVGERPGRRANRIMSGGEDVDAVSLDAMSKWMQGMLEQQQGRDHGAPMTHTNATARAPVGVVDLDASVGNYADARGGNGYNVTGGISTRIPVGSAGVTPGARVGAYRSVGDEYDTRWQNMPVTGTLGLDMPVGDGRALLNMERPRGGRASYNGGASVPFAGGEVGVDAQYSPKDGEMAQRRALMAQYRRNF